MFQYTQTVELVAEHAQKPGNAGVASVTNQQIAEVLFNIATILEMQQGNQYRIAAYRNAARGLMALPVPASDIIRSGTLLVLPGLGRRLRRKITELVTTGRLTFYDELCAEALPDDVRQLMTVPRVGPLTALRLTGSLNIHNVAGLYEAAHTHKLREHHGFGPRSEARLEQGAERVLRAQQPDLVSTTPGERPGPQAA
jgi:DNA polymerase/3'-5' exonuclease PolX